MTKRMQQFVIGILLATIIVVPVSAEADTSAERLQLIQGHCQELNTSLNQQQRRDLVSRTNRGRTYESYINQLQAFVERLRNNKMNTQPYEGILADFKTSLTQFRAAYIRYDAGMSALRRIDCRNKPTDFANQLEEVRALRRNIGSEVSIAQNVLSDYRREIVKLQKQLTEND